MPRLIDNDTRVVKKSMKKPSPYQEWFIGYYEDTQFVGGVFVDADGLLDAVQQCHQHGIRRGGQIDGKVCIRPTCPPEYKNKFLVKNEIEAVQHINMPLKYVPLRNY